jgi:hypothetical protein
MPVILQTQHKLNKPSPWSAFAFRHEYDPRPETKMSKQNMPELPKQRAKEKPVHGPFISRDTGDMPAQVVEPSHYHPLSYENYTLTPGFYQRADEYFKKLAEESSSASVKQEVKPEWGTNVYTGTSANMPERPLISMQDILSLEPIYETGLNQVPEPGTVYSLPYRPRPSSAAEIDLYTNSTGVQAQPSTSTVGVQTGPYPITQHPEFFDTIQGVIAFEQQEYQKQLNAAERAIAEERYQKELYQEFIQNFLFGHFKVPIEMAEELDFLMGMLRRVEGHFENGRFIVNRQSQYNRDLFNNFDEWLRDAAAAGQRVKLFSMGDITSMIEDYINRKDIPKRGRGVTKKKKVKKSYLDPRMSRDMNTISSETMAGVTRRYPENIPTPQPRRNRNSENLTINTNVPRRRGPRAPTTATQPEPDTSQITAANIVPGRRQRKTRR